MKMVGGLQCGKAYPLLAIVRAFKAERCHKMTIFLSHEDGIRHVAASWAHDHTEIDFTRYYGTPCREFLFGSNFSNGIAICLTTEDFERVGAYVITIIKSISLPKDRTAREILNHYVANHRACDDPSLIRLTHDVVGANALGRWLQMVLGSEWSLPSTDGRNGKIDKKSANVFLNEDLNYFQYQNIDVFFICAGSKDHYRITPTKPPSHHMIGSLSDHSVIKCVASHGFPWTSWADDHNGSRVYLMNEEDVVLFKTVYAA